MTQSRQIVSRPSDDGFYLPAEWCRHARTWIAWPTSSRGLTSDDMSFKKALEDVVIAARKFEPVTVIANGHHRDEVYDRIGSRIDVLDIPHETARIRDLGPTFLVDGKGGSTAIDWRFDGWAQGVPYWDNDAKVSHALLGEVEIRRFRAPLTLEGTAICCDGEGTVLALGMTPLDVDRNAGISKLDAYGVLSSWLGVSRVIWINQGIGEGPEASELRRACAFVAPAHVVVSQQKNGPWSKVLDSLADRLQETEDAHGRRPRVDRLPLLDLDGRIATYTTFYIMNTAILMPSYDLPEDDVAKDFLRDTFPGRTIRQVNAKDLLLGGASVSSVTQYQPARLLERNKATLLPKSAWQRPVPDYVGLLQAYIERVEAEE